MAWAVTGANGQLGTALCSLVSTGDSSADPATSFHPLTHQDLDITKLPQVERVLTQLRPEGVINTAAYNFVDKAEDAPLDALELNSGGPMILASVCKTLRIPLLHVSTDFVFAGDKQSPYTEDDTPAPLGAYGRSKLSGEKAVRDGIPQHFIVRTCGVYGRAASVGKGNFVETMLRLARERDHLKVVNDQRCTPTSALELARGISRLIRTTAWGTYHLTCSGDCSWYEFAVEILRQAGLSTPVIPITSAEFAAKAPRPPYSVLNCDKFIATTTHRPPTWQSALTTYLNSR